GGGDREIEVAQGAAILGVNERLHVRVIATEHGHLRPAPGSRRLDGFARLVEHTHVGEWPAGAAVGAPDVRSLRPDAGEVVADAAAPPHRLRSLVERRIDADLIALVRDAV